MKIGYSLLLGEFVPADQVRYGDTAGFQIVCPCCKDPVFKTERAGDKDVIEFLSHYPGKPGVETCELRVAGISNAAQHRANSVSRGQTLKVFLSTLRDAVSLRWAEQDSFPDTWADVERSFGFAQLCKYWEGKMLTADWLGDDIIEPMLDHVALNVDLGTLREQGGLALSYRRRLTKDIVGHLRAPHAARNRKFIVHAAIKDTFYILLRAPDNPRTEAAARLLWDLCFIPHPIAWNRSAKLIADPAAEECTLFHKLHELTQVSVARLLMSLPVTAILVNHRAGRPPLQDVQRLDFLPYLPSPEESVPPAP